MKKILLSLFLLSFGVASYAQSIGVFLDFYLGQSMSEVRSIVNTRYTGAEWDGNKCTIKNVRLAGESFKYFRMEFQNNTLIKASFWDCSTIFSTSAGVDNFLNYQYRRCEEIIGRLYVAYSSKYGKESIRTSNSIIWNGSNGNILTISIKTDKLIVGGEYFGSISTDVDYSKNSFGNY